MIDTIYSGHMGVFTYSLTEKEIKEILDFWDKKPYGITAIAKKTKHGVGTVRKYLRLNGRIK